MPFDLSTAQPAKKPAAGFDVGSAQPSRAPGAKGGTHPLVSPERRAEGERRIAALEAERGELGERTEQEQSLGGRVKGTLQEIGDNFGPEQHLQYLKDYGKGIATSLEETDDDLIDPGELLLGVGAPAVTYPLAMAAGGLAAPFSGDYGGVRDAAFENLNSVLPEGAQDAQRIAGSVLKPIGDVIHTGSKGLFTDIGGELGLPEPLQQNLTDMGADLLGFAGVKAKAPKGTPGLNAGPPKRAPVTPGPTADPLARARDAGYKIAPSARTAEGKSAAPIGGIAEGASGRTQMQHRVDQQNDMRVLEGIRKDLGLPAKAAITKPAIDAIMNETSLAYKAVAETMPVLQKTEKLDAAIAAIGERRRANPLLEEAPRVAKLRRRGGAAGDMKTDDVMAAVQEFRDTARTIREGAARTEKPEMQMQMASAYREMADLLEAGLDDALKQNGRPDLIPALKNARMKRAKAYQALEAVSGKKRPGVALMDMKLAGETLSGEMDLAADVMRDMSPNGPLHVNMARGAGGAQGDVTSILQGVVRPAIQPLLTSEFGQARMFGPRVPESLAPYAPEQFEVPPANPTIMGQGDAFGGPLEFEPPGGNAGGAMPSDVRRLNSTIAGQQEGLGPLLDLEPPVGDVGGPRLGPADPNPVFGGGPDRGPPLTPTEALILELEPARMEFDRQRALGGGSFDEQTALRELFEQNPGMRESAYRSLDDDLNAMRQEPGELPTGVGLERGSPTAGPIVSEFGDFERTGRLTPEMSGFGPVRANDDIGNMIGNERLYRDASVDAAVQELQRLGFSPEEIAELLVRSQ